MLNVRGIGVVFTRPVAYKETAIACERNTLQLFFLTVHPNLMPATICLMIANEDELDEAPEGCNLHPIFGSTLPAHSLDLENGCLALCLTCLLGWMFVLPSPDSSYNRSLILIASVWSSRCFIGPFLTSLLSTSTHLFSRLLCS